MKPTVVAAVLGFLGAGQALGAELPPPETVPAASYYPSADYNWSGPYFVLNGGFGFGTSNWSLGGLSTGNFNVDGSLFGGTFGANFFQINGFVFGGEGDFDWSNIGGDRTETTNPAETGHYGFVPIVFLSPDVPIWNERTSHQRRLRRKAWNLEAK